MSISVTARQPCIKVSAISARCLLLFLLVISAMAATGCSGYLTKPAPPVSIGEIVGMSKAGSPPADIIDRIRRSGTVYRLTASQLADLRAQGVSDQVINYMQQTHIQAVRRNQQLNDQRYWTPYDDGYLYGGYPFGWNDGWYPDEPYPEGEPDDQPSEE